MTERKQEEQLERIADALEELVSKVDSMEQSMELLADKLEAVTMETPWGSAAICVVGNVEG